MKLSSKASRTRRSSTCLGQTQRRSVLGSPPTTSLTSPSRPVEPSRLLGGSSWSGTPRCTPVDSPASERPGDGLRQQLARDWRQLGGHEPHGSGTPRGSAMSAWPQRRAAPNRSQHRATVPPTPNDGHGSTSSRRTSASSTRSWPFFTRSWDGPRASRSTTCTGRCCVGVAP
jgi:hypothetical protein